MYISTKCTTKFPLPISPCKILCWLGANPSDRPDGGCWLDFPQPLDLPVTNTEPFISMVQTTSVVSPMYTSIRTSMKPQNQENSLKIHTQLLQLACTLKRTNKPTGTFGVMHTLRITAGMTYVTQLNYGTLVPRNFHSRERKFLLPPNLKLRI